MTPELIALCIKVALLVGPDIYKQLATLLAGKIPTFDELMVQADDIQALINKAKQTPL